MIKGWRTHPGWRHYFDARETMRLQREAMATQTRAAVRSVEIQEEQHRDAKALDTAQRQHMEECHAEKVAAGELPPRKTN